MTMATVITKHTPNYQVEMNKTAELKQAEIVKEKAKYNWTPIHNVVGGEHHKQRVQIVLNEIANIVSRTFGPGGELTYIFDRSQGNHVSTKDGYSVLKHLTFIDELSCLVLDTVRSSARKVARSAGDGSTTSVIMANYIFNALKGVDEKLPSSVIHAALESISTVIETHLQENAIIVNTDSDVLVKIASIAANNNLEVGSKIANIFKTTPNASVLVERGNTEHDEIIERKGFRVYTPLMDSIFATSNNTNQTELETCTLNNSDVFICDFDIQSIAFNTVIAPCMNKAFDQGKAFTIIANDFSDEVKKTVFNFKRQNPDVPLLLMTHSLASPDSKNRLYDLAAYTNSKVITATYLNIDPQNIPSPEDINISSMIGFATKVNAYDTYSLIEADTHSDNFENHIQSIEDQIQMISSKDNVESGEDILNKLNKRVRELSNKSVIIKVGGRTEIEREYKFFAYEDAVIACTSAITDGITPGGAGGLGVLKYLSTNREDILNKSLIEFSKITQIPFTIGNLGVFLDKIMDAYFHCLELVYTNMKFDTEKTEKIINKCLSENLEYDIIQCEYFESQDIPTVVTPIKTDIAVLRGSISIVYTMLCSNQTLLSAPHLNDSL